MKMYRTTIKICSALGTPLVGDSLFGQFCWAMVNQYGEQRLSSLLQDYDKQMPFLVLSDAFPQGYLPLPCLPSRYWQQRGEQDRKVLKKKQWITLENLQQFPVEQWQMYAKSENEIANEKPFKVIQEQMHNTIRRDTSTTGTNEFAPYSMSQIWYQPEQLLDIYCVLDEQRLPLHEFKDCLTNIGLFGFGRDASIGLGKFEVVKVEEAVNFNDAFANSYLTLANTAPQGLNLQKAYSYYQITTRFGRHGDRIALANNPFKKPIILAKAGAVLTPEQWQKRPFLGNGLAHISYAQQEAVHQGYAPVIPLSIRFSQIGEKNE